MPNHKEPANKLIVHTGMRFGNLTVIKEIVNERNYNRKFLCKCDCGNETEVFLMGMRSGKTRSCGCYQKQKAREANKTHGLCNHRLYDTWSGMMQRCNNINSEEYSNYGGRGIKVCDEWKLVENFIKDMDDSYQKGLSIDRIDNNKGYSKCNCKWSTNKEQSNNRRTNRVIEYNNKNYTLTELCEKHNMNYDLVRNRLNYGIGIGDAIKDKSLVKVRIMKMDLCGNDMQEFDSVEDAARSVGVSHSGISRVISGEQKQSGGFKWRKV